MKILAIEKELPGATAEAFRAHLKTEAGKVWELYQKEVIREIYFGRKEHNAVIILECRDENEARELLNTLPLVREGLIAFDIIGLEPYSGFSRLFEGQS